MNNILKRTLASVCATAAIITSGLATSITASANNCKDRYWLSSRKEHSSYAYEANDKAEKMDASSVYVKNDGWSSSRYYGTEDLRVWLSGSLTRSGYATQTYDISTRNGHIVYVGAVRVPERTERLIYQYIYENGVSKGNSLGWPRNSYTIWASISIQSNYQRAGRWSPDSVGWYPAAQPF